jgi:hypothetical protein
MEALLNRHGIVVETVAAGLSVDPMTLPEPTSYGCHFTFRTVSDSFLEACAQVLLDVSDAVVPLTERDSVTVTATDWQVTAYSFAPSKPSWKKAGSYPCSVQKRIAASNR